MSADEKCLGCGGTGDRFDREANDWAEPPALCPECGPRCRVPSCPDYGDPDFGEATCPSWHADTDRPEISEDLCDCGHPMSHELTCAYLDALYRQKVAAGDVIIVGDWGDDE